MSFQARVLRLAVEFDGVDKDDTAGTFRFEFDGKRLIASASCGAERLDEPSLPEIAKIMGITEGEVAQLIEESVTNLLHQVATEINSFASAFIDIEPAHGREFQAEFADGADDGSYWFDGDFLAWIDSLERE